MSCPECPHLEANLQFWWGFAGGAIAIYIALLCHFIRLRKVAKDQRHWLPLDIIIYILWGAFPGITGLISLWMEAPSKFFAGFIGVAVAAMSYFIAANSPNLSSDRG